ncbi:MAG: hypothetical protein JSR46_04675 [Verrucomicrobia bacterium]|nr:hypothetical protein [Verrucomicrobiota bacterium]
MEPVSQTLADYPLQTIGGQDPLLTRMAEYAVSNTTFLNLIKDIARGTTTIESAFNDNSLLITIGKAFLFDITNIQTLFTNLDARVKTIAQQDNDWNFTLTMQESALDETKGTILNFVTEIGFLLHQQLTDSFDSNVKAVIKYLFLGSVESMRFDCLNIAKLHIENFNVIIDLLNS